jgi:hypothetical protein
MSILFLAFWGGRAGFAGRRRPCRMNVVPLVKSVLNPFDLTRIFFPSNGLSDEDRIAA